MTAPVPRRAAALALTAAALAAPRLARAQAAAPRVRLQLDWAFQSPNAFALVARERGFFREAGVEVAIERGTGSGRVPVQLASGAADLGFADINPAIRFAVENPDRGLLCVAVLLDRSPLCAIVRADGPVRAPKDLEGRTLAAPEFDAGRQLFPAFARVAGIDKGKVNFLSVSPELREPMLVQRRADGVTGFVTTSALALKGLGLQPDAQRVLLYADHGLDLYGSALLTTRDYARANPDALKRALAALFRGVQSQLADPAGAMAILRRAEPLTDVALETERHALNAATCILTPGARRNGLSAVEPERLGRGIAAVEEAFGLPSRLKPEAFYTPDHLPPAEARALPPPA
ncbi:ABC transporter substrate-binding protein [Craurococcus roseus]|uniref:Thiamine pyrimidine synthase n=1 Tax=Craurococcus roseus TaxID=77585 RepID=A0ABP3PGQ5_9PROT